jgi:peptide/nickel transport system permease protein
VSQGQQAVVVSSGALGTAVAARAARSPARQTLVALVRERWSAVSLVILALIVLAAVLAPLVAPYDPLDQDIAARLKPPMSSTDEGAFHLLGTDALGRDILSRLIYGSRISLVIGLASVVVAGSLGVLLGLVAGYAGGRWDGLIMRIGDIQLAVPFLVLALATVAVVGPSLTNLIVVLGVTGWVVYARVVRAETLSVREREYVQAARVVGAAPRRILWRHILPNVASSMIVVATLQVARMVLFEASLSFLGLGVPPPTPTWGGMVADGRNYVDIAWWVTTIPGLTIFVAVLAITMVGDRLRDVLDPRLRGET